jgi:aminoglycoside phosphotransferase (APT) family kinase protein
MLRIPLEETSVVPSVPETICREVLRLAPRRIQPVRPHLVRVVTNAHVLYFKFGSAAQTGGRFGREAWAYRHCRAHGVLAPDVLAEAQAGEALDYVATSALPGRALWARPSLSGASLTRVLRAAGKQLRAMHAIQLDGFGPVVGAPPRGAHARWCPFVGRAHEHALPYLVGKGVLSGAEADSIGARLAAAAPALRRDAPGRLLHGDLEGDHLFAHRGRFTGFLDFEKMQAGDPCYDLARFAWWDPHLLPALLDGYGRDALTADDRHVRMPVYLLAAAVVVMAEEVQRNLRRIDAAGRFIRIAGSRDFAGLTAATR